jgi:hypothetical protein
LSRLWSRITLIVAQPGRAATLTAAIALALTTLVPLPLALTTTITLPLTLTSTLALPLTSLNLRLAVVPLGQAEIAGSSRRVIKAHCHGSQQNNHQYSHHDIPRHNTNLL